MNIKRTRYDSVEDIKADLKKKGLLKYSPSEIYTKKSSVYWAIYRFAKRMKKSSRKVWEEVGIKIKGLEVFPSIEACLVWAFEKKLIGKNISEISKNNKTRLVSFANKNKMGRIDLYNKIGIKIGNDHPYESIDEILSDILAKGLFGKTPNDLMNYDDSVTLMNIRRFAERKQYSLIDIYKFVGVTYSEDVEVRNGKVVAKFAYYSLEEIKEDLKKNGLVGKSPTELKEFDGARTWGNITKFAKREKLAINKVWGQVGIKPVDRSTIERSPKIHFYSLGEIKKCLKRLSMPENNVKALRVMDDKIYKAILEFAKKEKMQRGVIWKELGLETLFVANSIEDIISLLEKNNLRKANVGEIRSNEYVHNAIFTYASKNGLPLSTIWKLLGIKNAYQ